MQPYCSPTRATLLTGRHVIHTGIYGHPHGQPYGPGNTFAVLTQFTMLPEWLRELGYESHAVGKWHLGMFSRSVIPTGRGFETFFGYYGGAEDYFTHESFGYLDLHDDTRTKITPATGTAST